MKKTLILEAILFACLLPHPIATAQTSPGTSVAPGSSLPGLNTVLLGLDGPGYIEVGGSHSALTAGYHDWTDFYLRGMLSGGRNVFTGEITRQDRFGASGWFYGLELTRTLSESWYADISAGGSPGAFFLPKFRTDASINRKLLRRRQLVATVGGGFDQSQTVNKDWRAQAGGAYYFEYPVVLQAGVMWTHASPGNILARAQYLAVSQGHQKEYFISLRYEWGREGYEIIGPTTRGQPVNALFNFPEHTIGATWRQWIGPNWGFNLNLEQHQETSYHRFGGTAGVFLDF